MRDITEYLSYVLMMPETARKLASLIIKEIEGLDFMPSRFQVFPHEPWASQGIRCLPVKNIIFSIRLMKMAISLV